MATLSPPASMVARWCADDLTGAHNTAVATWTDQVSGKVLAAGGSTQPLLYKGSFGINGHSVVKFDGLNDAMSVVSYAAINIETLTLFVLLRETTLTASKVIVGKQDTANITPQPWSMNTPATASNIDFRAGDGTNLPTAAATGQVANTPYAMTGARTKNATVRIYRDGTQITTTADTATGTSTNAARLSVGGRADATGGNASTTNAPVQIAEIIICNDDSTVTRRAVHSFFQDQYGVTVSDYLLPPTIILGTQTAHRTLPFNTSTAGVGGALSYALVRLSGPAATITQPSTGVFDVEYTRPLTTSIVLEVTVTETGGLAVPQQLLISPEAAYAHLVFTGGAWV